MLKSYVKENTTIIEIPAEFKYLNTDIMSDLPNNAYIHKGVTGCGGTTLALTNDVPYVIAVPMIRLITNKTDQHPHVLGVYNEIDSAAIAMYIAGGGKKIMVTYDSLGRLLEHVDVSKFKLMIDESQMVVQYAGTFKKLVCNKLLEYSQSFKSVVYMTATPTDRKYLPEFLQSLDYYYFDWLSAVRPSIKTCYVSRDVNYKALSLILDILDNTNKDIYVFYNYRRGVISLIKQLMKVKPEIKLDDIKIMFADNDDNYAEFESALGKNVKMESSVSKNVDGTLNYKNKRINFLSSMGFQGLDFYSEVDVVSLIISDSKRKSMRYDISIDLPQIAGRFRKHPLTGFVPDNDLCFLWTSYDEEMSGKTEEEYEQIVLKDIAESKAMLNLMHDRDDKGLQYDSIADATDKKFSPYFMCTNPTETKDRVYDINELAYSSLMSVYSSSNIDFKCFSNKSADDSIIINKIKDCFIVEGKSEKYTLKIDDMSVLYKKRLNKSVSFTKLAKEYHKLHQELNEVLDHNDKNDIIKEMNEILLVSDDLSKYMEVLDSSRLSTLGFSKNVIEKEYNELFLIKDKKKYIQNSLKFKKDSIYTNAEILTELTAAYITHGITLKPKSVDISKFYDVKSTTLKREGVTLASYRIIGSK